MKNKDVLLAIKRIKISSLILTITVIEWEMGIIDGILNYFTISPYFQ